MEITWKEWGRETLIRVSYLKKNLFSMKTIIFLAKAYETVDYTAEDVSVFLAD